jgi:hypothetical protein
MDAELKAYEDSIEAVGAAVAHMKDCKQKLHAAVEAASESTGKKVAEDTAAQPAASQA